MSTPLIVTLPGYDATDPFLTVEHCAVNSDYSTTKMSPNESVISVNGTYLTTNSHSTTHFNFGWVDVTFSSNPAVGNFDLITLAHGLGYTPAALVYCQDFTFSPSQYTNLDFNNISTRPSGEAQLYATSDSTNLHIKLQRNGNTGSIVGDRYLFKYYIFVENGA